MADFDAETFAEQAVLLGLVTREQVREVRDDAEDGSIEAMNRCFLRKGMLTSWQIDRLLKGEAGGFYYGGCKVLFHIAEGTFARVYRGRKQPGNQSVAIKVLRKRFTSDAEAVKRFTQEAESGLKLVHPNIVRIYDFGEQERNYYMIMEYVEGSNLRDFLRLRTRLNSLEALPLMMGLADGLSYAIEQGVTHRDIKGTNILISTRQEAKLVDFGLATLRGEDNRTAAAHGQRTVDYSALERTCGSQKGDPRSDIYFLGCVFYQMLTGVLPLPEVESADPLAKMLKRSFGAIKPLSEHRHAPDERLTAIIERMMKIDLKGRHGSMKDVVEDLRAYKESLTEQEAAPAATPARAAVRPAPVVEEEPDELSDEESYVDDFETPAYEQKHVLCVEAQSPIQEAFRKTFSAMGYRVLIVGDAERAADRFRESPPHVVVFDADGLGPEALRAFLKMHEKAHEDGHELSAVVLLGPRQARLKDHLPTDDRLVTLVKPIKMKDVQDALTALAPSR